MLQEDKQILWRASAVFLGAALPCILVGKSVVFVLLVLGIITGLMATKDESLRVTIKLLLNSRITAMVLVLMASLLVGVATGINPMYALDQWGSVCLFLLFGASLFVTLREMPGRHVELLLKVLAIATMSAAVLALVDALAGYPRLSAALHGQDMALTPYRLNFMSSALAIILPFVWARVTLKSREGEPFAIRIAPWVIAFSVIVALACGGRAGWVGLVAGALVFLGVASRYHGMVIHKKHWVYGLLVFATGLGLYALAFGWDFMMQRATIVGEIGVDRGMLSGRLDVWAQALGHIWDAPLFGVGVMNYRHLSHSLDWHPHNWFIQLLLEGGIVSTVIFMALMGMILWRFVSYAKGGLYGVAALASLVAFLVAGLAHTSIFNGWWLTYLIVTALLGWRVGWGGVDLKKRRRASVVVKPRAAGN